MGRNNSAVTHCSRNSLLSSQPAWPIVACRLYAKRATAGCGRLAEDEPGACRGSFRHCYDRGPTEASSYLGLARARPRRSVPFSTNVAPSGLVSTVEGPKSGSTTWPCFYARRNGSRPGVRSACGP
jgi:hypothetical protein